MYTESEAVMKGKIDCPICETEIDREYYAGERGTEEEYYHCTNCGYGYDFAYGNYQEIIDGEEYSYTYHSLNTDSNKPVRDAFERMKQKYINN